MDSQFLLLALCFFSIALIYSSVGFGGGSSYLALLALMNLDIGIIRPTALLCNIIVVSGGTFIFWRSGALDLKKSWPFICASIPMAFIGGYWKIEDASFFFIVLGICLIAASVLLWVRPAPASGNDVTSPALNAGLGAGIGFLSGFVGIGGGIFLSPILHLLKWGEARRISALASLFILVNSFSGLGGQIARSENIDWRFITPLLIAVFLGGQVGSRLGARRLDPMHIKRLTSVVIFLAAVKILGDHL